MNGYISGPFATTLASLEEFMDEEDAIKDSKRRCPKQV